MGAEAYDVPWSDVFRFVMENPDAEVVGRVRFGVGPDGEDGWTFLDPGGQYGLRFSVKGGEK